MRHLDVTRAMIRLHRIHRMRQAGYPLSKECVYTTDDGDEFVKHPYSDYYNVEVYERKNP